MGRRVPRHRAKQWLGQHFLKSPELADGLVQLTNISASDVVIEIGAGKGLLTEALARRAGRVVAVEIDAHLATGLIDRFSHSEKILTVCGDVFDFPLPGRAFRVFGNIPFARTTHVLHHLLDAPSVPIVRADLIVQRGAAIKRAQRWNLLNLCWAPWWDFTITARIEPSSFRPRPSVEAALLTIERKQDPLLPQDRSTDFVGFARCSWPVGDVRTAVKEVLPTRVLYQLSTRLGFSPSTSPQRLDIHQWIGLFRACSVRSTGRSMPR